MLSVLWCFRGPPLADSSRDILLALASPSQLWPWEDLLALAGPKMAWPSSPQLPSQAGITRWQNMENVPTLTIFFIQGFGWPPPLPLLLYKICFSKFQCFFVLWSQLLKNVYLQPQHTIYQLMNFQITVKDALHASLCTEEHTLEITQCSEF